MGGRRSCPFVGRLVRKDVKRPARAGCGSTNSSGKGKLWSGRPDSNRRHQPWQGCTLPTELLPLIWSAVLPIVTPRPAKSQILSPHRIGAWPDDSRNPPLPAAPETARPPLAPWTGDCRRDATSQLPFWWPLPSTLSRPVCRRQTGDLAPGRTRVSMIAGNGENMLYANAKNRPCGFEATGVLPCSVGTISTGIRDPSTQPKGRFSTSKRTVIKMFYYMCSI